MDVPYNLCIIDKTLEELNKIMKTGKTRDSSAAKLGLAILGSFTKQKSLKTLASFPEKSVDDAIVRKANKKVYIATQDRELRKRAKKNGAHIISLKQKKYLSMEWKCFTK